MKKSVKKVVALALGGCLAISAFSAVGCGGSSGGGGGAKKPSAYFDGAYVQTDRATVEAYAANTQNHQSTMYACMVNNVGVQAWGYGSGKESGVSMTMTMSAKAIRRDMQSDYSAAEFVAVMSAMGMKMTESNYNDGTHSYTVESDGMSEDYKWKREESVADTISDLDFFTLSYVLATREKNTEGERWTETNAYVSDYEAIYYGTYNQFDIQEYYTATSENGGTKVKLVGDFCVEYYCADDGYSEYLNLGWVKQTAGKITVIYAFDAEYRLTGVYVALEGTRFPVFVGDEKGDSNSYVEITPYDGTITPPTDLDSYEE